MADPTPLGQCFAATITACLTSVNDLFREGVSTCLFLSSNRSSLNNSLRSLEAVAEKLKINVEEEETSLMRDCSPDVREWLEKVKEVAIRAKTLLANDESPCSDSQHGTCSCKASPTHRFRIGRRVIQTLGEVNSLLTEGNQFTAPFTSPPRAEAVLFQPIEMPILGIDAVMLNLWGQFNDKSKSIIGLHGPAGIGKTTVLKWFNNELREQHYRFQFQVVIMLEVANAEKLNVVGMQRIISDRLGLRWDDGESDVNRATLLHKALTKRKFVVLLDNVWEKFELADVGVPTPGNGSKLIIASRSESVCGSMGVSRPIEIYCLQKNDAWQLFLSKLTEKVKAKVFTDYDVNKYAQEILESCGGLPLAIKVISFALTASDIPGAWYHAAATIKQNPSSIKGVDRMLTILKYSYDMLNEKEKKCFLYCTMFPGSIRHKQLKDYWVAEALISPESEGYSIIEKLIFACLLQRSESDPASEVKMHQMIRIMGRQQTVVSRTEQRKKTCRTMKEMQNKGKDTKLEEKAALCSSEQNQEKKSTVQSRESKTVEKMKNWKRKWHCIFQASAEDKFLIKARQALERAPDTEEWEEATRISLMSNDIKDLIISPNCKNLLTLLLQNNPNLHQLCPNFFNNMPALKVLDLSHTAISLLPDCSRLHQLVYLNLSHTPIKEVPMQLCNELVELQYLNMSHTLITELPQQLANLKKLTQLNLEETLALKVIPHGTISMLSMLKYLNLYKSSYGVKDWSNLNLEKLWKLTFLGITIHSQLVFHNMRTSDPQASCTHLLSLSHCPGMKSMKLAEFKMLSNLMELHIESCNDFEELIIDCDYGVGIVKTVKVLTLVNLPNLVKVSHGRIWSRFEPLSDLTSHNCPKLEDASWALQLKSLERLVISNCDGLKQLKSEESVPAPLPPLLPQCKMQKRGEGSLWETIEAEVKQLNLEESVPQPLFQIPEARRPLYTRSSYYLESITVDNCPNLTKLPWRETCPNLKQICGGGSWWETIEPKEKADFGDLFVPI